MSGISAGAARGSHGRDGRRYVDARRPSSNRSSAWRTTSSSSSNRCRRSRRPVQPPHLGRFTTPRHAALLRPQWFMDGHAVGSRCRGARPRGRPSPRPRPRRAALQRMRPCRRGTRSPGWEPTFLRRNGEAGLRNVATASTHPAERLSRDRGPDEVRSHMSTATPGPGHGLRHSWWGWRCWAAEAHLSWRLTQSVGEKSENAFGAVLLESVDQQVGADRLAVGHRGGAELVQKGAGQRRRLGSHRADPAVSRPAGPASREPVCR